MSAKRVTPTSIQACLPPGVTEGLLGFAVNFSCRRFPGAECAKRASER